MRKLFTLCLFLLICNFIQSQTTTVILEDGEYLLEKLSDSEIENTEKIIVKGKSLEEKDFSVLKKMIIQNNLRYVDIKDTDTQTIASRAFESCSNLEEIILPKYLYDTGWYSFYDCVSLKNVDLPNTVKKISNSFRGCKSITSISIGYNVEDIDGQSFLYCSNLKEVHCKGIVPPACEYGSFEGLYETCTLYVPKGYKRTYEYSDGWLNFMNIKEEDNENVCELNVSVNSEYGNFVYEYYPSYFGGIGGSGKFFYPYMDESVFLEKGETINLFIELNRNYRVDEYVESVIFNGEDITEQLVDGHLLSLVITEDSNLEVTLKEKTVTSNESIENNDIIIKSSNNGIIIENIKSDDLIYVYDISGTLCYYGKSIESKWNINLPANKVYIIRIGNRVYKINI